jgi:DNA repair photolyase
MSIAVREITCKSALTKTGGFLSTYTHSMQPYKGCVFGCPYCYVQALPIHRYHGGSWGQYVDVKVNIAAVLARELARIRDKGRSLRVFMSSATDPYQGSEAKYGITRKCLEAFIIHQPDLLVVQTRSPLVRRDLDLIRKIRNCVLSMTIETDDDSVRRSVTPGTPSIKHRLDVLKMAMEAGITVQAAVSPMLPNNATRLAQLLDTNCHRVVVDTYFDGDGSGGKRTEQLGIRALYDELGYANWYHGAAHIELLGHLSDVLGPDRIVFSKEGFNSAVEMISFPKENCDPG